MGGGCTDLGPDPNRYTLMEAARTVEGARDAAQAGLLTVSQAVALMNTAVALQRIAVEVLLRSDAIGQLPLPPVREPAP